MPGPGRWPCLHPNESQARHPPRQMDSRAPSKHPLSMQSRPSCSFLIRFKLVTTLIHQEQYSISCSCTARYHSINIFFQMRVRFFCYATSGARPSSAFVLAIHACLGHHHPTGSDRSLDTLPLHAATTISLRGLWGAF